MQISVLDWVIVIAYLVFALIVGLYYSRRAGQNIDEFFVSGRRLPWWLAGTSMVATTFAADTPLAVTGLVANHGIAGNWLWWNMALSGLLTAFLFARLWRRAEVLTDVEFTEIRYSGKPAAFLRAFRAIYLAVPVNCIIMGWVTLAMAKIMDITLGIEKWVAVVICLGVTLAYSALSGLWGVVITDFFQFILAIFGTWALAIFALKGVGGIHGLKEKLASEYGSSSEILSFFPDMGSPWMPVSTFLVYLAVQWWAAWYPGAEPGGGGYIAQRMFSAKNEKHALFSTLWFNIAHYCLRPWPWILVALVSMAVYPDLADKESGYIQVMVDYLPVGFRGLLLAAFAAAFMSTISTQLNWGTSYLINDFYRRFINTKADHKHYVFVSRLSTLLILGIAAIFTYYLETVAGAWKFLLALGAGTGSVYILRWYWWRINAWSEISAMVASFTVATILQFSFGLNNDNPIDFVKIMLITVGISSFVWLITTLLTPAEPDKVLVQFYKKVRPGGRLWKPIAQKNPEIPITDRVGRDLVNWLLGAVLIYTLLFGVGKIIFGEWVKGLIFLGMAIFAGFMIFSDLKKREWTTFSE